MASQALRAIPEKEEARSEIKEEDEEREVEAEARPEDNEIEEAKREVVESSRTPLVTQATPPDNDDIVTRAVDVMGSGAITATPFLQSSWNFFNL